MGFDALSPWHLLIIAVILLSLGYNPIETLQKFLEGALGKDNNRADVIMTAVPLLLSVTGCRVSLAFTRASVQWSSATIRSSSSVIPLVCRRLRI